MHHLLRRIGYRRTERSSAHTSRAGGRPAVFVYPKPEHEPAGFTVLNLAVEDLERAVDELADQGIVMQRLDGIPQDQRGIYHGEGHSMAWFRDPAGNTLAVVKLAAMP